MAARKAAVAQTAPAAPQEGQQVIDATEAPAQAADSAQPDESQPTQDAQTEVPVQAEAAAQPDASQPAQDAPPQKQATAELVVKVKNVGKHDRFEPMSRTALPAGKTVQIKAKTEKALQAIKSNVRQMNDLAGAVILQVKE